jgi:hypothetical protein
MRHKVTKAEIEHTKKVLAEHRSSKEATGSLEDELPGSQEVQKI